MKLTKEQVEILINLIKEIAEEVVDDHHSRGSDYAGMGLHRIKERAEEIAENFNLAQ